ncbi:MAG: type II secretion system protein [Deltaproteobacteria bacterium]|nr:type II secretion system protein [Deltaproteobacteria bacterium]MBW2070411.1 type II secretion system protein [Deltaproteobacteria bacterium]
MKFGCRGMTLIQLLVAASLLGILTCIAVPWAQRILPNYYLSAAARCVVRSIHRARMQTIRTCSIHYLDFAAAKGEEPESSVCILWQDRNGNGHKDETESEDFVFSLESYPGCHYRAFPTAEGGPSCDFNNNSVDAGEGDGVTFNKNRIKFNPNGTCSSGTIYLHNRCQRTFAIRLLSTGTVRLWLHENGQWLHK